MHQHCQVLSQRTWYQLRVIAHVHRLRFSTHWTRAQAHEQLYRQVVQRLKRAELTPAERRALHSLQAAEGYLPRHQFSRNFGSIRPCTQRRPTNWRIGLTPAERLWLLGFIELSRDGRQVWLTWEAAALLPPLPQPQRLLTPIHAETPRAGLCTDVAAFLGTLLRVDVVPRYGRWLPPRLLRQVNAQLRLPGALAGVRSERNAGRLSFLHYLAEAAGLVAVQGGFLKPSAAAWDWLALPPDQAWAQLWQALVADRTARRIWTIYRVPEVDDAVWSGLVRWLSTLAPGSYTAPSLIAALHPYCPALDSESLLLSVEMLLETIFTWLGWATWEADAVIVHSPALPAPQPAAFNPATLTLDLTAHPPLLPYARLLGWCEPVDQRLTFDEATVRAAIARGATALTLAQTIADLSDPLSEAVLATFKQWEQAAHALRLETLTVLTASDPAALDALCADRGLRPLIEKPLSRHHLAVRPEHAPALCRRLHRRGQPVTDQQPPLPPSPPGTELYAYCYLAVRALQGLGAKVSLPATIPDAVRRWLADQLPAQQVTALDQLAARTTDAFAQALDGHTEPPPITPDNPDDICAALQQAYNFGQAVTIDYFSPARGAVTTRCIEPICWYERGARRCRSMVRSGR
ncbi:MAG: hypothetical protein IPO91_29215 [Chloroflexi bacterium]|nr:hypothetical protein [Chloroflexota bacterium]